MTILKLKHQSIHYLKNPTSRHDIDIKKVEKSSKVLSGKTGFQYLIGYRKDKKVRLLCLFS